MAPWSVRIHTANQSNVEPYRRIETWWNVLIRPSTTDNYHLLFQECRSWQAKITRDQDDLAIPYQFGVVGDSILFYEPRGPGSKSLSH